MSDLRHECGLAAVYHLPGPETSPLCPAQGQEEAARLIGRVTEQLSVSGRGLHRILRIARTVADLDESSAIGASHLAEAIQLRRALPETLA